VEISHDQEGPQPRQYADPRRFTYKSIEVNRGEDVPGRTVFPFKDKGPSLLDFIYL
jgi:hypothetical protein